MARIVLSEGLWRGSTGRVKKRRMELPYFVVEKGIFSRFLRGSLFSVVGSFFDCVVPIPPLFGVMISVPGISFGVK